CHARRVNGRTSASSLDASAADRKIAVQTYRRSSTAMAARMAKSVTNSDVRPLIHTSAMLIPWGLTLHANAATAAANVDRRSRRHSVQTAATQAKKSSTLVAP